MKGLVVTRNSPNKGSILQFGFVGWDKGPFLINAKSETVNDSRIYKKLFHENRCLIPASHFFEWKLNSDGKTKTPYLFKLKKEDVFALAGIYRPDDGFVILTTKPNNLVGEVHNRMPVILHKDQEDIWLNPNSNEGELTDCFAPFPEDEMEAYPVSNLVNSAKNQSKEIIEKLS